MGKIVAAIVVFILFVIGIFVFFNKASNNQTSQDSSPNSEDSQKYSIEDFKFTKEENWADCTQSQCYQKTILDGNGTMTKEGDISLYTFVNVFDLITITSKIESIKLFQKDCSLVENQTLANYSATTTIQHKGETKEIIYPGCKEELEQIEKLFPKTQTN